MKKKVGLSFLALIFSFASFAQTERTVLLSIDPVKAFSGTLSSSIAFKVNDGFAITVPFFGGTMWNIPAMAKGMSVFSGDNYAASLYYGGLGLGTRFLLNNNGFNDGFYVEPQVGAAYSKYKIAKDGSNLIDSKRLTLTGMVFAGYSWFFESGLYMSPSVGVGVGYHAYNDTKIDDGVSNRLKDEKFTKYMMWAESGRFRPMFAWNLNIGYSW